MMEFKLGLNIIYKWKTNMPKKLERCVKKVKRSKGGRNKNAWAICNASINKRKKK